MATLESILKIRDSFTATISSASASMRDLASGGNLVSDVLTSGMVSVDKAIDTVSSGVDDLTAQLKKLDDTRLDGMDRRIRQSTEEHEKFNNEIKNGTMYASGLVGKFTKLATLLGSFFGVRAVKNLVFDSLDLVDTQIRAERQLAQVLSNQGANMEDYLSIKQAAANIQDRGMYDSTAMTAGAAEFATYISDPEAIESMMGTLANYAAGMSGGIPVDARQMTEYATQLGKALDGTLGGLKIRGFDLTDAQKQIIETGTDLEKALVIDDVISQSWAGLYEQMSNTPANRIAQIKNAFSDIRTEIGDRLYPVVLEFVNTIASRMPQIEQAFNALVPPIGFVINLLSNIIDGAFEVYQFFTDNWSMIAPIVWGIVGALVAYNVVAAITNGLLAAKAVKASVAAAAKTMLSGATFLATVKQHGLNAALLACPLTWIILLIAGLVAALYAAVGAMNKFAGTSVSATGIIAGTFAVAAAHIYNKFVVPTWNALAALANFFANVFNEPAAAVKVLFYDMCQIVIGYILNMARAIETVINNIPYVQVNITAGLDNLYNGLEAASKAVKDESGYVEVVGKLDYMDYVDAFSAGYQWGENFADNFGFDKLLDRETDNFNFDFDNVFDGINDNTSDIAENTAKMAKSIDIGSEQLKYLRDIAEREAINVITTKVLVPQTNFTFGDIRETADVDEIMDKLVEKTKEAFDTSEEGKHI